MPSPRASRRQRVFAAHLRYPVPMQPAFARFTNAAFLDAVEAIAAAAAADGFAPELIVGIGRGGLVPATFLSHRLDRPMVSLDISADLPGFGTALLPSLSAAGKRLLLVDDINDSGRTIAALRNALAGTALRVAVLIDNRRSIARADYRGEEIDRAHEHRWFVFPWEALSSPATLAADADEAQDRLG